MEYSDYEEYQDYEPDLEKLEVIETQYKRDTKRDEAKGVLRAFFKERKEGVFYLQQLKVKHEKKFFHWIMGHAIDELLDEGVLRSEVIAFEGEKKVKFVFNRGHRYYRRQMKESAALIQRYSALGRACGMQAENLIVNGLGFHGFSLIDRNVKEYQDHKWEETEHNLDFIIEKDGVPYGCEVKNKLSYIKREELEIKIKMCDFLRVKPVFFMRWAPQSYNWQIIQNGGYAGIFEMQIYPFGHEALAREISEVLGLPVDCPWALPDGIIKRFDNWHKKQLNP